MLILLAAAAAPDSAADPKAEVPAEERKICRKEIDTGSRIKGRRVCMTAKEWQRRADEAADDVRRASQARSSQ